MARRMSFSSGLAALVMVSGLAIAITISVAQGIRTVWNAVVAAFAAIVLLIAYLSVRIEQQYTRDEAQTADVILVLGAAEYHGRPSPVLRARLDHALELYNAGLAPRIMTTGGAGG